MTTHTLRISPITLYVRAALDLAMAQERDAPAPVLELTLDQFVEAQRALEATHGEATVIAVATDPVLNRDDLFDGSQGWIARLRRRWVARSPETHGEIAAEVDLAIIAYLEEMKP
jgi:hypothetical protein